MALDSAIPVRFDEATSARLKSISDRTGIAVSKLVRMATEEWLDETERAGKIQISLGALKDPSAKQKPK